MKEVDLAFCGVLILGWVYFFWNWSQKEKEWIVGLGLAIFHAGMTFLAYRFIEQNGGDSQVYWRAAAFPEPSRGDWIYVLPYSAKFFLMGLRPFAGFLGLSFLSGTLIFSSLGLLGFLWMYQWTYRNCSLFSKASAPLSILFVLILFLPNAHFWTSLVSKESLLFFLSVLAWKLAINKKHGLMSIALLLSILIRPVYGLLLLLVLGLFIFQMGRWTLFQKSRIAIVLVFFTIVATSLISVYLDDFELNWGILETYAQHQYERFNYTGADTWVPMEGYTWINRLVTVAYRPLVFDGEWGTWVFFVQIENTILLLLSLGLPFTLYYNPRLIPYLLIILVYFLSLAVSANVLGVFVRLKSIVTPFLALMGGFGWSTMLGIFFPKVKV